MKRILIIVLFLIFFITHSWSQELLCGTVYSHEDSATSALLQRIHNTRSTSTTLNDTLYFRVQIHIIRTSSHITSLNLDSLQKDLNDLNIYYRPAAIQFYICNDYNYIDDDQYYTFYYTDEAYLINTYNDPSAINIYFAQTVHNTDTTTCAGYSYRPTTPTPHNFIIISNTYIRQMTIIHEMGHFFNLLHTHETKTGIELVNGSNCQNAGDLCCDTPADPGLSDANVNSSCIYTEEQTDPNGDLYTPNPHNIMSYARKKCRDLFTADQYERVRDAAYLQCRQILCNHHTKLENGSITSNTTISNDIITIKNYYLEADSIKINACHEIILNPSVTLQKGVILNTQN